MAVKLAGYAYTGDGTAIESATVNAYTYGTSTLIDTTSTDSSGYWEFAALADGGYDVRIQNGSQFRYIKANIFLQVARVVGLNGTDAPLPDASITAAMLKSTVIPDYSVAADTVTAISSETNKVDVWFGGILTVLKSITGKANWWESADETIADVRTDFDAHTHDGSDSNYISFTSSSNLLGTETAFFSDAWYDGPSITLAAGKWLLIGVVNWKNTSGSQPSHIEARIWDGTTTYQAADATAEANQYGTFTVPTVVTLASETTVKISCREFSSTGGTLYMTHQSQINSLDDQGTNLYAVRIG